MERVRFKSVPESAVSRAILENFYRDLRDALNADVFVVGAGPSGLVASYELAKAGVKVYVIEQNNYLGGGFWLGGYFMNTVTVRYPAQEVFDEIGVRYEEVEDGLYAAYGPLAASKLIAAAAESVKRLADRGLVEMKGLGAMNVNASEDTVVEYTGEVFPGLIVSGMAVAETFGLSRMGPTFGGMLLSGKRAAQVVLEKLTVSV